MAQAPGPATAQIENDEEMQALESEKRKMREEFDMQRAKMKELFLQKEDELIRKKSEVENLQKNLKKINDELDETKSQLVVVNMECESNVADVKRKADEEIASLQHLIHETVEESSSLKMKYDTELQKLLNHIKHLKSEVVELKTDKQQSPHHHVQQEMSSLAPSVVLSAVTKKLAKKLGADAFTSQDDDHREDTELLKSLVGPLEEEIKALKDKLRSTDEQLQKCKLCGHHLDDESQVSGGAQAQTCDMCSNYEAQLVREQAIATELEAKVAFAEKSVERHKEELLKEIGFRKDMEEKWNEKKEVQKVQVAELTERMLLCEKDAREVQTSFGEACEEMRKTLSLLTREREKIQQELERLQKQNETLIGKYSIHSRDLQNEVINLPDTVEELQEVILKMHQDLIIAKIAKEMHEDEINVLRSDNLVIRDQMISEQHNFKVVENELMAELNQLKNQVQKLESERQNFAGNYEKLKLSEHNFREKLVYSQESVLELTEAKKKYEEKNAELRSRVASLQQELETSETVQKDFVRLSQNLQIQLEKIRDADTQVRWQHDEDADECSSCRTRFHGTGGPTRRREHCRHCGQIFCTQCLTHQVPSGPKQRMSRVCDVCHTLLVKSSAPYFSTEAPHSPD